MNEIKITDNKQEMEAIGARLIESQPAIYNKKGVLRIIRNSIEHHMPDTDPKEKEKRLLRTVYNYWVYGNTVDEDFYLGFDNKSHDEKNRYMTMRLRRIYTFHLNDPNEEHLFNNKYETYERFKQYYFRDVIQISLADDYKLFLDFVKKHSSFVVKPSNSWLSMGVYRVDTDSSTDYESLFKSLIGKQTDRQKNESEVWTNVPAVIIEELIQQDDDLGKFHPHSVNGVRITTVRIGNTVHIYYPWIKVGADKSFVASAGQGGMVIGIDPENGILNTDGFGEIDEHYTKHPLTGVTFRGSKISRWNEAVELARKLALSLPENINYIGWDFVLTPHGWCVMEGNYTGDFMWQLFLEQGMKKEFEDLIGWKFEKSFWWQK